MKIHAHMNLSQLSELMGTEATLEEAAIMCEFLLVGEYADTSEIDDNEWLSLLDKVGEAQRHNEAGFLEGNRP